jgi:hypothetical protein
MELTKSYERVVPPAIRDRYDLIEVREAAAVISQTNPVEFGEIMDVLEWFSLGDDDFLVEGGQKSNTASRLDLAFRERGWREGRYDTNVTAELTLVPYKPAGETEPDITRTQVFNEGYKVDNVKGRIALDVEWNAKDGNLDRDISAYRALYEGAIITAAVIITRSQDDLRALGTRIGRNPFGTTTTTNLPKLQPRLTRGDSGGCPVLAVAITARCYQP